MCISFKKFLPAIILLGGIFYFLGWLSSSGPVRAAASDNVSGFAWSENIGWISLNCANTSCASSNYGVNISPTTGNFSGFAWSENVGWIDFAPAGPYPSSPNYSAKLDFGSGQVSGWIKALASADGWDGWIKTRKDASDPGSDYGVNYNNSSKKFSGWAWGNDVVGWVSFNGKNCDTDNNGYVDSGPCGGDNSTTPSIDYYVFTTGLNAAPTASNLTVSSPSSDSYCPSAPQGIHTFSWTYSDPDGNNESKFQFQADDNSDFSSLEINREITSAVPSGTTNNQSTTVIVSPGPDRIDYNKTYYWRVKVFDSGSPVQDSGWINGSSFQTASHPYPKTDFTWSPQTPEINKITQFTDTSTVYGSGQPIQLWSWTFQNANPSASSAQNPSVTFTTKGDNNVSLNTTDKDGYSCQTSKTIRAIKEIKIKEI